MRLESQQEFDPILLLKEGDSPAVYRGACSDFDVVRKKISSAKALSEYCNSFYSGRPVLANIASRASGGRFFYNPDFQGFNFRVAKVTLPDALESMCRFTGANDLDYTYVGSMSTELVLPGWSSVNGLDTGDLSCLKSLWLGTPSRIAPHFDMPQNIVCNLIGRRKFILFPPEQVENMYIGPIDNTPAGQPISLVDPIEPDFNRFPLYEIAEQHKVEFILEPGDVLFIPSLWWHYVEGLSNFNLMQNYWYSNILAGAPPPMAALYQAVLSLRTLPERDRKKWKSLFDYYIWDAEGQAHIPKRARGMLGDMNLKIIQSIKQQLNNYINRS